MITMAKYTVQKTPYVTEAEYIEADSIKLEGDVICFYDSNKELVAVRPKTYHVTKSENQIW